MTNKLILFSSLFCVLLSCNQLGDDSYLFENTGKINEIILVMEDDLWTGSKGDILRKIFEKDIQGLPQSEQFFNLIQINQSQFNRIFHSHKNIMFVSEDVRNSYSKNKWAKSQIVIYLNSDTDDKDFRENSIKSFNYLDRKEMETLKYTYQKGHNKDARFYISENFGFDLYLPTEYTVSLKSEEIFISDFHSFSENQDLLKYIIVYEFTPSDYDIQNEIIKETDLILQKYILGIEKGTYVQIDRRIPLTNKDGIYRGIWRLENGFMGGPFVLKTRYIGDKIIVSLGLVFYPNENKRKHVRIFESIL